MADNRGGGTRRNGEIDIEQDLAFRLITEIDMRKTHLRSIGDQWLGMRRIGNLAMLIHQAEQALHVSQALLDFAVQHTKKIQRNIQLDHEGIHQYQITQRHSPVDDTLRCTPQNQCHRASDDHRLTGIQ